MSDKKNTEEKSAEIAIIDEIDKMKKNPLLVLK